MTKGIHYLQIIDDRKQSPLRRKCIESVKAFVKDGIDTYEMVSYKWDPDHFKCIRTSEYIRFEKAKNIPNLCYVDSDCFVLRPCKLQEGKPYFAEYSFNDSDPGVPDIYYFYVNGCNEYFKKYFANLANPKNAYSIDIQVLRSLTNFNMIPSDSYVHCYTTMNYLVERQNEKQNEPVASYQDALELAALKKHVELMVIAMKTFEESRIKDGRIRQ